MKINLTPTLCALFIIIGVTSSLAQTPDKNLPDSTKKVKKSAGYSKKTIITFDQNGVPHEEIIENFEGDENLRDGLPGGFDFDFEMPDLPDFDDFAMPQVPFHFPPNFQLDSADGFRFGFNGNDFEHFGKEMQMLLQEKMEAFGPQFEESMRHMQEQLRNMDLSWNRQLNGFNRNLEEELEHLNQNLERELGNLEQLKDLERLEGLKETLSHLDADLQFMQDEINAFEEAAQEQLIQDGYLKPGEQIESIEWTDDTIKFNGQKIKTEHQAKYRALKEQHVKKQWRRGKPE